MPRRLPTCKEFMQLHEFLIVNRYKPTEVYTYYLPFQERPVEIMCLRLVKIADWSLARPLNIVIRMRCKTYVLPSGNDTF